MALRRRRLGRRGDQLRRRLHERICARPDAAIAIDVTHTADYPSVTKNKIGDIKIGGGPVIERGSGVHTAFAESSREVAAAEGIPHQFGAAAGQHLDRRRRRPSLARRHARRASSASRTATCTRRTRSSSWPTSRRRPSWWRRSRGGWTPSPPPPRPYDTAVQRRLRIVALVSGTVMVVSIALYGRAHSDSLRGQTSPRRSDLQARRGAGLARADPLRWHGRPRPNARPPGRHQLLRLVVRAVQGGGVGVRRRRAGLQGPGAVRRSRDRRLPLGRALLHPPLRLALADRVRPARPPRRALRPAGQADDVRAGRQAGWPGSSSASCRATS